MYSKLKKKKRFQIVSLLEASNLTCVTLVVTFAHFMLCKHVVSRISLSLLGNIVLVLLP